MLDYVYFCVMKYPRTYHIQQSLGVTSDDKIQYDLSALIGKNVIVTIKMDGENTTLNCERVWARSLDSNNHPSRNWVKGLWGNIAYKIPSGIRICGENLYAKHSIHYTDLPSYFMAFSVWEGEQCFDWDSTVNLCTELGLEIVPVIYRGIFDESIIDQLIKSVDVENHEGFVIRLEESFTYSDFSKSVVKWVRKNHVQTDKHWSTQPIIKNLLK